MEAQVCPCGICGGQTGIDKFFSRVLGVFLCDYCFTNAM